MQATLAAKQIEDMQRVAQSAAKHINVQDLGEQYENGRIAQICRASGILMTGFDDAKRWRVDMRQEARRAQDYMGSADACITATESDVRMFCRDALSESPDNGYRCLAAFPPAALREPAIHVIRADPRGRARLEVVVVENCVVGEGLGLWLPS